MKAKKSLGQHFLKSEKALRQIIEAGAITPSDTILEIGPGHGALTKKILETGATVVAIEKDESLIPLLSETYKEAIDQHRLHIISGDILTFAPEKIPLLKKGYKLIANIPYYITGAIIEQFLSSTHQPKTIVLLIQKEVAERIVARDQKQSMYSIAVAAYGTPRIIDKVPAGAFVPAPKVDSAILQISTISKSFFSDCSEEAFFKITKAVFGKKRKQILGSLAEFLDNRTQAIVVLDEAIIDHRARPETIKLTDWKKLTQIIEKR